MEGGEDSVGRGLVREQREAWVSYGNQAKDDEDSDTSRWPQHRVAEWGVQDSTLECCPDLGEREEYNALSPGSFQVRRLCRIAAYKLSPTSATSSINPTAYKQRLRRVNTHLTATGLSSLFSIRSPQSAILDPSTL